MTPMDNHIAGNHIPDVLYRQIRMIMPIVCVDLVVMDRKGKLLLVKRNNDPAKGEWWFPGGRVFYGETRIEAAKRKLQEECGLAADSLRELFTEDCILHSAGGGSHAVTTFYMADTFNGNVSLDAQSREYSWEALDDWEKVLVQKEVWPYICKIFSLARIAV